MDKPITPAEQLVDAVAALRLSLEKLQEMLEILACEAMLATPAPVSRRNL